MGGGHPLALTGVVASSRRSLGVHLSKVRSLTLDWWEPEQLKVRLTWMERSCRPADLLTSSLSLQLLCILGNDVINEIYEARCPEGGRDKPRADSRR